MARISRMRSWQPDVHAVLVAGGYILVALLWIWGSDWLVEVIASGSPEMHHRLQTIKGSAFVLVTGVVLFAAISAVNARERRLAAEKRLVEEMLAVSQRLEALGTLAGTLVHDFNNILTVIRSQSELVRLDGYSSENLPEHLQAIDAATQRADQMVREIMQFMRKSPVIYSLGELSKAVEECLPILRNAAGRAVEVVVRAEEPLPRVPFDRSQLDRSLLNLVINARDAMDGAAEKRITIGLRRLRFQGYRSLFRREPVDGEFVALSVADTGCGISRENYARIFSPFFTTKPAGRGMGLGLTSVLRVAEAHGGWVEVSSEIGQGACFTLYFPTEAVARARATAAIGSN